MSCLRRALVERALQQYSASCSSGAQGAAWYSTKSGGGGASGGGADGRVQRLLKALEVGEVPDVAFTEEELAEGQRRVAEYSRQRMREHRLWQADLSGKLKLKEAAIAALPPDLVAAAREPDYTPFPANRQVWTETPPVEGFAESGRPKAQADGKRSIGTKKR